MRQRQDHAVIAEELGPLLPMSSRVQGALFEQFLFNADVNNGYRFEQITAPTVVIPCQGPTRLRGHTRWRRCRRRGRAHSWREDAEHRPPRPPVAR
jgi:hypothetical protein